MQATPHNVSADSTSDILTPLAELLDRHLRACVRAHDLPLNLEEAILYTIQGGGKRLRPALVLLAAEATGGAIEDALDPAVALELIHTFSLVHDDLPAMDDDDMRRGRPTLHVQAGEAMAILAGDAMMSIAFELICGGTVDDARARRIVAELGAGTTSMIVGQVRDTIGGFPHELTDDQRVLLTHRAKTGALLRAACRMGALASGAADRELELLTRYGEAVGLMFQIVDDILDVTADAEQLGKAVRKDVAAGKLTWPGVHGLDAARAEVERLRCQAAEALAPLGPAGARLRCLADDMAVRTR